MDKNENKLNHSQNSSAKKRDQKLKDKNGSKESKIYSTLDKISHSSLIPSENHSINETITDRGLTMGGENLLLRESEEVGFTGSMRDVFNGLENSEVTADEKNDDPYFRSYESLHIHKMMIQDEARTDAYHKAIMDNAHLFKDKIVMDVGCGTGILSIFAARAGAKHVYAIEYSETAKMAVKIISENEFSDRITVIQKKAEDLLFKHDIPEKVDIIISEWMGFCLLYEGMLDSVLHARDHFLKDGGLLFPNKARIFINAIDDNQYKQQQDNFWAHNKYGISMKCARNCYEKFVFVDGIYPQQVISKSAKIFEVDINTCTTADLEFANQYEVQINECDEQILSGFVMWFEVEFNYGPGSAEPVILSTSPFRKYTHWKHQLLYIQGQQNNGLMVAERNEIIHGSVAIRKSPHNPRDIEIKLSVNKFGFDQMVFYYLFC